MVYFCHTFRHSPPLLKNNLMSLYSTGFCCTNVIFLCVIQTVAQKVPFRNWLMAVWTRMCWRCEMPVPE